MEMSVKSLSQGRVDQLVRDVASWIYPSMAEVVTQHKIKTNARKLERVIEAVQRIGERLGRHRSTIFRELQRNAFFCEEDKTLNGYTLLSRQLKIKSYYCDPRSPWQKGTVENTNSRIRRFLPRNTDLEKVSNDNLIAIADRMNNTPRKCLGYRTPKEVFESFY